MKPNFNKELYQYTVILFFFCCVFLIASQSYADEFCNSVDLHWLRCHVAIPNGEIVAKEDLGNVCEVMFKTDGKYLALYAAQDFLIVGALYKDHEQRTGQRIETLKKADFISNKEEIEGAVAIQYEPDKPSKRTVYMFTDPFCPYCKKAGPKVKAMADKYGVTIKTLFYNVHGDESKKKAIEAICRKFTLEQYNDDGWKKEKADQYQCGEGLQLYKKSMSEAKKLGITGVPIFYMSDGTFIKGDVSVLEDLLKNKNDLASR